MNSFSQRMVSMMTWLNSKFNKNTYNLKEFEENKEGEVFLLL